MVQLSSVVTYLKFTRGLQTQFGIKQKKWSTIATNKFMDPCNLRANRNFKHHELRTLMTSQLTRTFILKRKVADWQ